MRSKGELMAPRRSIAIAPALMLVLATSVHAVDLSRYQLTVNGSSRIGGERQGLDLARVRALCKDEDGCELTVRLEYTELGSYAARVVQRRTVRFLVSSESTSWAIDDDSGKHMGVDGDHQELNVLEAVGPAALCTLSDAEENGVDHAFGFSLTVVDTNGRAEPSCTLTMND
jgi:hypothetical protein